MLHFPPFSESDEKNGAFQDFRTIKSRGISRKNHVTDFKTGKEPKMTMFDFGTFQDFRAYALTCKINPSHAFWDISRNRSYHQKVHFSSKTSLRIEKMIKVKTTLMWNQLWNKICEK